MSTAGSQLSNYMASVIECRRIIIKGRAYFIIMPDLGTSNFKEILRHVPTLSIDGPAS
jgi:hypothetical protein